MNLDKNGNGSRTFVLTGLPDSPPPPGNPERPFEAPRRIIMPGFFADPDPPVNGGLLFTGWVLPSQVVWAKLVEYESPLPPEPVEVGKVLHKIIIPAPPGQPPEGLAVEVRMEEPVPDIEDYYVFLRVWYNNPRPAPFPTPDAIVDWVQAFEPNGVAQLELDFDPRPSGDRIWVNLLVKHTLGGDIEYSSKPYIVEVLY
jgi:hypothetical protein